MACCNNRLGALITGYILLITTIINVILALLFFIQLISHIPREMWLNIQFLLTQLLPRIMLAFKLGLVLVLLVGVHKKKIEYIKRICIIYPFIMVLEIIMIIIPIVQFGRYFDLTAWLVHAFLLANKCIEIVSLYYASKYCKELREYSYQDAIYSKHPIVPELEKGDTCKKA